MLVVNLPIVPHQAVSIPQVPETMAVCLINCDDQQVEDKSIEVSRSKWPLATDRIRKASDSAIAPELSKVSQFLE